MATNEQIIRMALSGIGVEATARELDLSVRWVRTLVARYRAEGEHAFQPRSKRPHTSPNATPTATREAIITTRNYLLGNGYDAGAESIAHQLHIHGHPAPSARTIHRILTAENAVTPQPHKRPRSSIRRFEAAQPNERWQGDFTHVRLANGTDCEVLNFIDDHSRFLVTIAAHTRVTGTIVTQQFAQACLDHGHPASTLTDNGMVFTSRFTQGKRATGKNGFEKYLHDHHIVQINGSPAHPQTQGKIERFHQTLKRRLNARPPAKTIEQLNTQLAEFQHYYNNERPHRALNRRTPAQAYNNLPKSSPETSDLKEVRTRQDRVDQDGKVSLRYAGRMRHLAVGRPHKGTRIHLALIDNHAWIADSKTGEILAEFIIDTTKGYQRKQKPPPASEPPK